MSGPAPGLLAAGLAFLLVACTPAPPPPPAVPAGSHATAQRLGIAFFATAYGWTAYCPGDFGREPDDHCRLHGPSQQLRFFVYRGRILPGWHSDYVTDRRVRSDREGFWTEPWGVYPAGEKTPVTAQWVLNHLLSRRCIQDPYSYTVAHGPYIPDNQIFPGGNPSLVGLRPILAAIRAYARWSDSGAAPPMQAFNLMVLTGEPAALRAAAEDLAAAGYRTELIEEARALLAGGSGPQQAAELRRRVEAGDLPGILADADLPGYRPGDCVEEVPAEPGAPTLEELLPPPRR